MSAVVINTCFGGFGLSYEAVMRYAELKGIKLYAYVSTRRGAYTEYVPGMNEFLVCYYTKPVLNECPASDSWFRERDISRTDPVLVEVVRELGERADGMCAKLKVIEVSDDVQWEIEEYDGREHIAEKHRTWG